MQYCINLYSEDVEKDDEKNSKKEKKNAKKNQLFLTGLKQNITGD